MSINMQEGRKRGSPVAAQTIAAARAARTIRRDGINARARWAIDEAQLNGVSTLAGLAAVLQAKGIPAPAGGMVWHRTQVSRVVAAMRRRARDARIKRLERA